MFWCCARVFSADDVITLYSFSRKFGSCGMCVSCIVAMCILRRISCCVMSCCTSLVVKWSGSILTADSLLSPFLYLLLFVVVVPLGSVCI